MEGSRRAVGTRTATNVLRHFFKAPTLAQKANDIDFMESGGELIVAAVLLQSKKTSGVHWLPQGLLHVTKDSVIWKGRRRVHLPDIPFPSGEWHVKSNSQDAHGASQVPISVESTAEPIRHYGFRVPAPDVELLRAALK